MLLCITIGQKYPPTCYRERSKSSHTRGKISTDLAMLGLNLVRPAACVLSVEYGYITG